MRTGPVLLTGASGLLGHWLRQTAPHIGDVVALIHQRTVIGVASVTVDLRDREAVAAAVASVEPILVVHAAYAKDRASIVDATRNVVDAACAAETRMLFISSDAVFLGDGRARNEQSLPDATWDYGRWKADAERAVLDASTQNVVVRLPLLVSVDPDDHVVRQIRQGAAEGSPTGWFTDEMRRPAYASEVAEAIWRIASLTPDEGRGCWHLAGAERLSRFEIARRMVDHLRLPPALIEPAAQPEGRPRDIVFTDARARAEIGWSPSTIG